MSHSHNHAHHHDGKLNLAVFINILLTIAQIIGGLLSGSLSLIADALHNLSDAGAILIAIFARRIARRPANSKMTFGFKRAEILGALINSTILVIVGLYLIYEALNKFFDPQPIDGWIIVWIASIALIIDAWTAWLTYQSGAKNNLNLKAAFIHNMSDALASVAVIVAGTLIILYQWYIVDLLATIAISIYVIYHGYSLAKQTMVILMQAVPDSIDIDKLCAELESLESVAKIWHLHVWQLDDKEILLETSLEFHATDSLPDLEPIKTMLKENYGIHHATIENSAKNLIGHHCYDVNTAKS
ncbi:cation diffusion facilitator family transporter [Paraglaciecola sp. L3A3]|uniref:cation diffusion facilitator family transporter n=1 Tax=Paraglaciecola sp. L3A3 TaxID=2686358 RepID=UPI00131AB1E5|nr:cation diffusion facilitator family transporter [Paraglaciecola sp. L3A3]